MLKLCIFENYSNENNQNKNLFCIAVNIVGNVFNCQK